MLKYAIRMLLHQVHPPTRTLNFVRAALNRKDLDAATDLIDNAKQNYPDRLDVNRLYARIHATRENWDEVKDAIERIVVSPKAGFHHVVECAQLLCRLGDNERAIYLYRSLGNQRKHVGKNAATAWNSLGHIYRRQSETEKALHAFSEAVCHGGRIAWAEMIAVLNDCSAKEVANCRKSMRKRSPPAKTSFQFYKFLSLLEQSLLEDDLGDAETMIRCIRNACEPSFKTRYREIRTDDNEPPLKPSFLIIGAMKCGTTTLFDLIAQHPDFLPPIQKELQFFQFPQLSYQWYLEHFPRISPSRGYITGEASPGYYVLDIVERVKKLLPDMKLIFIHRDPARRAISHVQHNSDFGSKNFGPKQAVNRIDELEEEIAATPEKAEQIILDITYRNRPHNHFLALGCYELLLRRWKRAFGTDKLLTIQLEELSNNPQKTMDVVFDFIGLGRFSVKTTKTNKGNYIDFDPLTRKIVSRLERFYSRVSDLTMNPE